MTTCKVIIFRWRRRSKGLRFLFCEAAICAVGTSYLHGSTYQTMRLIALLLLCLSLTANAQNWALLNPAYKYNYSNDGTDTISNQIFVTRIDTLGPDSFRYELNRIGVVCDTCPASLGGPCDGCYVRVDQPQFLGFNCIRAGGGWFFLGPDTILIRSDASVGATWPFNAAAGITATVDAEWPDNVFTIPDTLRRILLSSGDTLLLSQAFGILRFKDGGERYDLLGVEGAGVGRLFPGPLAYFDYQPGDALTYHISSVYEIQQSGDPFTPWSDDYFWQIIIQGRVSTIDSIEYTTSIARTHPYYTTLNDACNFPMPLNSWLFVAAEILQDQAILGSYPGQVLDGSICYSATSGFSLGYITKHGVSPSGNSVMRSESLADAFGASGGGFNMAQPVGPDLFPSSYWRVNSIYEEGIGLRLVELIASPSQIELRVELVGAIIGGDTIIPPPDINWQVGSPEEQFSDLTIFPNPASDEFTLSGIVGIKILQIHDLGGRLVRTARISSENEAVNVRDLQAGVYLLRIEGLRPQRLVIAR